MTYTFLSYNERKKKLRITFLGQYNTKFSANTLSPWQRASKSGCAQATEMYYY